MIETDIGIENFLNGYNNKKYVVKVETTYQNDYVEVISQLPKTNEKVIEKIKYSPFLFIKNLKLFNYSFFKSNAEKETALKKYDIKIIPLTIKNSEGKILDRLCEGYCYIVTTNNPNSYNNLLNFFKEGGFDIRSMYNIISNLREDITKKNERIEKYLEKIETIKNDNKLYDLENDLLSENPDLNLDDVNKNIEKILSKTKPYEDKIIELEIDIENINLQLKENIKRKELFFELKIEEQFLIQTGIRIFKGYDSYDEIHKMCFDIETTGLDGADSRVFLIGIKDNMGFHKILHIDKFDNESEKLMIKEFFNIITKIKPSVIYGYNSENFDWVFLLKRIELLGIDLNSIKTTLKSDIKINKRRSTVKFGGESEFYEKTNIWGINTVDIYHSVRRAKAINSDIKEAGLKYIAKFSDVVKSNRMYIEDGKMGNLWYENKLFLINKENNKYIFIPDELQKDFINKTNTLEVQEYLKKHSDKPHLITGKEIVYTYLIDDLDETQAIDKKYNESSFLVSKLLSNGFERTCTSGGASVWNILMTDWSYWNKLAIPSKIEKRDFTGGLSRTYSLGYNEKIQKADYAGLYPSIQLEHNIFPEHDVSNALKRLLIYFRDTRNKYKILAKEELDEQKKKFYDAKQSPLKVLNNSNFGASGSEYFNWADFDKAEEVTCRGRQYLRSMVKFLIKKSCIPIVLDTDGIALTMPSEFDEKLTKELFKELNNDVLGGKYLKVDDDGKWESCICLARKNYANLEYNGKIKLVGNSIKSSVLPEYIEVFFNIGIRMLLKGKGKDFIEYYYHYLEEIFTKNIPIRQIASKSRVKRSVDDYLGRGMNKNGKPLPKQAHMELIVANKINVNLGDVVYYVNNGSTKSSTDVGVDKKTGKPNAYIILEKDLRLNPDMKGEYNVTKCLSSFNKALEPLLVCFKPNIKETLLKKLPEDREYYLEEDMILQAYTYENYPFEKSKIDSLYSDGKNLALFKMEEKEVNFWNKTGLNPYDVFDEFTTEIPLEFDRKFFEHFNNIKIKLEKVDSNKKLKTIKNELEEDDIVLQKINDEYVLSVFKNGEFTNSKIVK